MEWFGSSWQAAPLTFSEMRRNGVLPTHCSLMFALPGSWSPIAKRILFMRENRSAEQEDCLYPLKVFLSDPKRTNWPSRKITLDATGLGR